MAGRPGQEQEPERGRQSLHWLAGTLAVAALPQPALSETPASALQRHALEAMGLFPALDLHEATYISVVMGVLAVSILTALVHLRERRRWNARERRLLAEVTDLREVKDRSELLLGSERQLLVAFLGRDGEARFEGDPSIAGESASVKRVLAFGSWLAPADAGLIEAALEHLRQRGEGFRLTVRTLTRSFVEAEGRTIGGRAILRLRDVTGDHSALLQARSQLASAKADLGAMTTLLDSIAHPLWIRDAEDRLVWANESYLRAVEAGSVEDAVARSLELLDRNTREEAGRRYAKGGLFDARVSAVMAGQRHILDVAERPTAGGCAGIAVDVSELESVRADLQRQMDAHVRTLDQLPTAVAIFDGSQHLVFNNPAYQRLWSLDQAFLERRPSDSEVLDRLRASRKLPEQADFRSWKADILSGYQATEPQETWWHLPDRRTLRVVINPNPKGGSI